MRCELPPPTPRCPSVALSLVFSWNLSRNINDILIPHLKRACQLTDLQSSLVQSAFVGGYFLLPSPSWVSSSDDLACVGLCTSVMYPILVTLSIKDLGTYTKTGSSLLIMSIVGGASVPPLMGLISDALGIRPRYCATSTLFFTACAATSYRRKYRLIMR